MSKFSSHCCKLNLEPRVILRTPSGNSTAFPSGPSS
ncbi:hypothetical protein C368_05967 [Cryptococcus neoformans 125.91]|nr:hypothetical protein C368_05967 [Cryptococcus neoformans var. grubii 125.91]